MLSPYRLLTIRFGRQRLASVRHDHTFRPLITPNVTAYANSDKAELIADCLRNHFTLNRDFVNSRVVDIVNSKVEEFIHTNQKNTLILATHSEVVYYIENLKKNKSSCLNCISSNMLMYFPLNFRFFLTILINIMLKLRMFPDIWKKALVVPVLKPGQDRHAPFRFRLTSFLSCLLKFNEYVLSNRLKELINTNSVIIPEQFRFLRPNLSTQHWPWWVTELIHGGFLKNKKLVLNS